MSLERIGNYEILGELGRGGMGVVYRGVDSFIKRPVAIKTIYLNEIQEDHERQFLKERLYREAQSAGILSHPNIVTIYQIGELDDLTYIVMEFVEGRNLAQMLRSPDKPSVELLLSIFDQTAAGLDHAHAQGVVHRDIKPANIIVRSDGVAKITDFGVAKITSQTVTRTGMTLGTPHYMAPEQIQGKAVDGRADQYALGVVIYEIFTGHKPFKADTITALIFKIVTDGVDPKRDNPNLSDGVSNVLKKALAKEVSERYPSCQAMVQAFRAAVGLPSPASIGLAAGTPAPTGMSMASGTVPVSTPSGASQTVPGGASAMPPVPTPSSAVPAVHPPTANAGAPPISAAIPPTATTPTSVPPRPPAPTMPPMPTGPVPPPAPGSQPWAESQPVRAAATGSNATPDEKPWRFPAIVLAGLLVVAVIFGLVWMLRDHGETSGTDTTEQTAGTQMANGPGAERDPAAGTGGSTLSSESAAQPGASDAVTPVKESAATSVPAAATNVATSTKPAVQTAVQPTGRGNLPDSNGKHNPSKATESTSHSAAGSAVRPGTKTSPTYGRRTASETKPTNVSPPPPPVQPTVIQEPVRQQPTAQAVYTPPRPIVRVPAIYPADARRDGISGSVLLQAVVNEAGQPTAVTVMRGIRADLDQAAKDALAKWRFQPGTSDGKPVESRINVEISFNLVQDKRKPISLKNP